MTGTENMSIVKQLQSQLKELSQATNNRNDYMEEVKKRSVSDSILVKARVANIEKNLKQTPGQNSLPVPVPMSNGINPGKNINKKSSSNDLNSAEDGPKKLKRDNSTPRETLDLEEDMINRQKSSSTSSVGKTTSPTAGFNSIRNTYATYFEPREREEHVLRPSLARTIKSGPTYKQITESHLKSQDTAALRQRVGNSVFKPKSGAN